MVARTSAGAEVASELLRRYPRSYAEELGIDRLDRPSDLFRLLVLALLMSARIRASIAVDAAAALFRERWRTARAMADASWEARARTLNRAGYARYDERTSTMLGETSALLLDRYKRDLRRLREEAGHQPATERKLIKECKGIGMRSRSRPSSTRTSATTRPSDADLPPPGLTHRVRVGIHDDSFAPMYGVNGR